MKINSVILGLSILALSTFANAADKPTVKMACTNFPPYKIIDKEGSNHKGIDLDVIKAAFSKMERSVEFDFYPWKRTVAMVERGTADALCGCAYRPEREEKFIYSDVMGNHSQGIFLKESSELNSVSSLADLQNKSIAAVRGYAVHKELKEQDNLEVIEANDDKQLLRMLMADRIDSIYSYRDIILYRMSFNSAAKKIRYFEFSSQPYYLCFSRAKDGMEQLVEEFNRALRTIRFDGTYQAIWDKYR
jgi:polar amino acid transport system substrate-binding protein